MVLNLKKDEAMDNIFLKSIATCLIFFIQLNWKNIYTILQSEQPTKYSREPLL